MYSYQIMFIQLFTGLGIGSGGVSIAILDIHNNQFIFTGLLLGVIGIVIGFSSIIWLWLPFFKENLSLPSQGKVSEE